MTPRPSPARADLSFKPVLTGEKAVLRPFSPDDVPAMTEILQDPEMLRFTGSTGMSFSEERLRTWYTSRNDQTDRLDLAVTDRAGGALVGEAVLNNWDQHNRSCVFRIAIGPAGRDRGLGTDAVRLIIGHGFERLGLHRVSLDVFTFNPRARRAYEKVGFVSEGTDRETLLYEGRWFDSVRMSLLDREWAVHRGRP